MPLQNIIDRLIGDQKNFSLEHRIFDISVISAILMSLQASSKDFLMHYYTNALPFKIFGLFFFTGIWMYSLKYKKYKNPALLTFLFVIFIYIPAIWISGGGINSPFQIYVLIFAFVITMVMKKKLRFFLLFTLILVICLLVFYEFRYPRDFYAFYNRQQRYTDYLVNIPIAILYMTLLSWFYYKHYRNLNIKLTATNQILEQQNREIIQQKDHLEKTLLELKNTQKLLIESEKNASLGLLTTGIAHELNTPIGISIQALSGITDRTKELSELIKIQKLNISELIKYLEFTYQSGTIGYKNLQRANDLIQTFKKISEEPAEDEKFDIKINSYFKDVIFSLNSKFESKKITFRLDCDESITYKGVPTIFAQLLTNLIMNSLIHGFQDSDSGQISVYVKKADTGLKIDYSDNGKGMKKELLSKIYDPFFTTDKKCGTGLGMHIVYNLVTQRLKGQIRIESDENAGFSCFITIP
jgi:signal transduction histidine kinase